MWCAGVLQPHSHMTEIIAPNYYKIKVNLLEKNTECRTTEPDNSPTHITYPFFSLMDPPARTQIGSLIYAEQTQTFLCIPTGVRTLVRSCVGHTSKQTTKLKSMQMDNKRHSKLKVALI